MTSNAITTTDQIPHSADIELAVIGAVLMDDSQYAITAAFLQPSHFFIRRHGYIWEAFSRLSHRSLAIDFTTVTDELKVMGYLEDVGGLPYLMRSLTYATSSINAETYGKVVLSAWLRREMLVAADVIRAVALGENEFDIEQARAEMARQTARVMGVELDQRQKTLTEIILERQNFIEERMQNPNLIAGIPTGLKDLDHILAGLQRGNLIILAGVAGMGKTSLMLTIAINAARLGKRILFVSQEMDKDQIVDRLLSLETGINLQSIRTGNLTPAQYSVFMEASIRVSKLPIEIDDNTVTPDQLRAKAMKWASQGGLDLLMLDYLQIMSSGNQFKSTQRAQEVGYFARTSKRLAKELHIPFLCAAQLNREVQGAPELRHLRDSGEIEQEADVVTFIYRPDYYTATERPGEADLIIAKQRNGPTGTVTTIFDKPTTKFQNANIRKVDMSTGEIRNG